MWTNPRYVELTGREPEQYGPAEPAAPPEPSGDLVASFARPGARGGPEQELRITADEYRGHGFIGVRLWQRASNGDWWPTKKGISIRLSEADGVAEALRVALDLAIGRDAERGA